MKPVPIKRSKKQQRELKVLLGLVELYLSTGKPIGSNTLKDYGFQDLSSATIRNYFASLESQGYLHQQHASGGRIPTDKAFRLYAIEVADSSSTTEENEDAIAALSLLDTKEVAGYLQQVGETLSELTHTAVFLSAPRFDHDVIVKLQLVPIDLKRCVCIILTSFGLVKTEVLRRKEEIDLTEEFVAQIEKYFLWRLRGDEEPKELDPMKEQVAQQYYNELMVRYLVGYSNFPDEEVYRTGFSQLLKYPELSEAAEIAKGLSLFENLTSMRHLLRECAAKNQLMYWVGEDLIPFSTKHPNCSVIAIPYRVNQKAVGAIALLGPTRIPYKELFGVMKLLSQVVSESLTQSLYKFKIAYREAESDQFYIDQEDKKMIEQGGPILLEDKRD